MSDIETPKPAQASPKRLKKIRKEMAVLEREYRVIKLRTEGKTYDAIAKELGYADASGARDAWLRAMARYPSEAAEEYRKINMTRLEASIAILWPKIQAGELKAFPHFMAAIKEEGDILGIYAPKESRVEVTTYDGRVLRERAEQIIRIIEAHGDTESRVGEVISEA
jgi:hypothetical protein